MQTRLSPDIHEPSWQFVLLVNSFVNFANINIFSKGHKKNQNNQTFLYFNSNWVKIAYRQSAEE
ncbi:hypothetical protein JCM15640A_02220 [Hoylesella timonensis 4401737 = DSM 22865 = JCM 15640]